jgi:hypothetical protein
MQIKRTLSSLLATLPLLLGASGCIIVSDGEGELTVENQSSFIITELYVAPVGQYEWGPDRLGGAELGPGDYAEISLDCDTYDVEIHDNVGRRCELNNVDVCLSSDTWIITNSTLRSCNW